MTARLLRMNSFCPIYCFSIASIVYLLVFGNFLFFLFIADRLVASYDNIVAYLFYFLMIRVLESPWICLFAIMLCFIAYLKQAQETLIIAYLLLASGNFPFAFSFVARSLYWFTTKTIIWLFFLHFDIFVGLSAWPNNNIVLLCVIALHCI